MNTVGDVMRVARDVDGIGERSERSRSAVIRGRSRLILDTAELLASSTKGGNE